MVGRIVSWAAGVVLVAMYAFALVIPVGNLLYLPGFGFEISALGWVLLVANALLPVLALVLALRMARRRGAGRRLLILLAGLALVGMIQLEQTLLVPMTLYFA